MPKRVKKVKKVKKQKQRQKQRVSVKIGNIGTGGGYGGQPTIVIQQPPVQPQQFQPIQFIPPIHDGPIKGGGGGFGGGFGGDDGGGGGGFRPPPVFDSDETMSLRSTQSSSFSRLSELSPDSVNMGSRASIPKDVHAAPEPPSFLIPSESSPPPAASGPPSILIPSESSPPPIPIPPRRAERPPEAKRFPAGGAMGAPKPPKLNDDRPEREPIPFQLPIGEREPTSRLSIQRMPPEPIGAQQPRRRDTQSTGLGGQKWSTVPDTATVDLTRTSTTAPPMVPLSLGQPKPKRGAKPTETPWAVSPGPVAGGASLVYDSEPPVRTILPPRGESRGGGLGALPSLPQPITTERPDRLAELRDFIQSRPALLPAPQTLTAEQWSQTRVIEPLKLKRKRDDEAEEGRAGPPPPPPTDWGVPNVPWPTWEAPPTRVEDIGPQLPPGNIERSTLFAVPRAVVMRDRSKK